MKNSGIDSPFILLENRANGYEYNFDGFQDADFINMDSAIFSAGAIFSTVEDLNLWENALFGDKFLSKKNKKLIFTPSLGNYGLDVFIGKFKPAGMKQEITSIGHHGGISGFSALLIRFVEAEITVILLDNTRSEKRGNLENISLGVFKILNGFPPDKLIKSLQVDLTRELLAVKIGAELANIYLNIKQSRKADYDFGNAETVLNNLGYFCSKKVAQKIRSQS